MAVISSPKPHILIIPGAWHPASTMEDFRKSLEAAGFPTLIVPTPSVGNRDVTVRDDEAQTTALLKPLIEDGKEVAVLGHSYGGVVLTGVTGATVGLDKRSRDAQGLKGGILGMIFLAAFIPLPDETMWEMASKKWYPFVASEKVNPPSWTLYVAC
jgi:pimeloyl-ACP methyl ester carboxylesterase